MPVAQRTLIAMQRSSWIRKMFETGLVLKKQYGEDRVFDFSLGNPDVTSPPAFDAALIAEASKSGVYRHGYMQNQGYLETRQAVADHLQSTVGLPFTPDQVIMTCGAAGAINVILKAILNPGEEVIVIAPFFTEYDFYIENHQGKMVIAQTTPELLPDLDDIAAKITSKTRAIIINSPNNPTGRVYQKELLSALGQILTSKSQAIAHPIYLISDEPYRRIVYDGCECPSVFHFYRHTILTTSFSKDLSLAGERIGYLAISPLIEDHAQIIQAAIFCNRVLGYINAPALMQRVIARVLTEAVDVERYARRRDLIYHGLKSIGYEVIKPEGAFYIFPKSPIPDDVAFIHRLQEQLIIATPGVAFYKPGYFRLSYAVPEWVIEKALPGFAAVLKQYQKAKGAKNE